MLVAALALAVRLPDYQYIPGFADEMKDVYRAVLIMRGQLAPLVDDVSHYNGALWQWLLAVALQLSGGNLAAPRTLALAFGVLTVVAAYALARAWSGSRLGGLVGGLLLATSPLHVALNSRLAWGNSVTPFFTTLGLWALWRALGAGRATSPRAPDARPGGATATASASRRGLWLLVAGAAWGVALQTHPSVVAMLAGLATYVLWQHRWLLRSRGLLEAGLLFLLVNLNLVIYNLQTGFQSIAVAAHQSAAYTGGESLTPATYLPRLGQLGLGLFQLLGGGIDLRPRASDYLLDPGLWPVALLGLSGLVWLWRRGNPLPLLLVIAVALLLPLFNAKYRPVMNGRYLAPLLPVVYAAVGVLFVEALRWLERRGRARDRRLVLGWTGQAGLALLAAFLVAHPWLYLQTFLEQARAVGRTNTEVFATLSLIAAERRPGEVVLLDRSLSGWRIGWGAGFADQAFATGLALYDIPYARVDPRKAGPLGAVARCDSLLLLRPAAELSVADESFSGLVPRRLAPAEPGPGSAAAFQLYRLERRTGRASDCPAVTTAADELARLDP